VARSQREDIGFGGLRVEVEEEGGGRESLVFGLTAGVEVDG
jgi:hypothetical protein